MGWVHSIWAPLTRVRSPRAELIAETWLLRDGASPRHEGVCEEQDLHHFPKSVPYSQSLRRVNRCYFPGSVYLVNLGNSAFSVFLMPTSALTSLKGQNLVSSISQLTSPLLDGALLRGMGFGRTFFRKHQIKNKGVLRIKLEELNQSLV